jgi:hypothetical protein
MFKPLQPLILKIEQYSEGFFPLKSFVVSKNCDPTNAAHTNVLTYTVGRVDGASLDYFLGFDSSKMAIKVAFQSIAGTYPLFLRGTLPNGQTVHETFTVIISEKPSIIVNSERAGAFG